MMDQMNRKIEHKYRLSYAQEVGSSFDPDMEDIEEWEREIPGQQSTIVIISQIINEKSGQQPDPVPWDDEELEAYAKEYERQTQEELFNLHDDILNESSDIADQMDDPMDLS